MSLIIYKKGKYCKILYKNLNTNVMGQSKRLGNKQNVGYSAPTWWVLFIRDQIVIKVTKAMLLLLRQLSNTRWISSCLFLCGLLEPMFVASCLNNATLGIHFYGSYVGVETKWFCLVAQSTRSTAQGWRERHRESPKLNGQLPNRRRPETQTRS